MVQCLIFDVDGVPVDSPHELAWGQTLRELLDGEWRSVRPLSYTPEAYTSDVYQRFVAGKPRQSGAASLLAHFGVPDSTGERAARLSELKQSSIRSLIEQGKFREFPDAVRLAMRAEAAGLRLAVASSSKNANAMLERVWLSGYPDGRGRRLIDIFAANVCGVDFAEGKPHPAIFLYAAELAGVAPADCVVVEDAPSGALAAKAGGMRCIGIARLNDEASLAAAGADWVVSSLDNVDLGSLG